jgi:uncharacterized repeat protein (TIGR01451 family)/fimbrial isopeptide formation D2 family protein
VSCSTSTSLAINASSAITIPVGVGASAVPSVVNKASVGGGGDPNNGGNPPQLGSCAPGDTHCASTTTPVSAAADIAVTKTVNNAAPSVGNTVTFTITAKNNGPSDATGVQVTDSLPVGLAFVGATPSTGSFNQTSGAWIIGALANGASATLTITATVTKPGAITNTATVTASDQTDPDISNNSSSATLNPPAGGVADIQVRKTVSNAAPNTGDTITYTIAVKNAGPDNATGVAITDALPAGLTFVSATPSQGAYNSASGVWTIGNIANGNTVTLAIAATVDGSVPGPIVNIAKKTAENQTDPDPTNDSSGVTINGASADIQVVKSVNNTAPNVGDTVTFTIAVRNNGPDDATNVQVTDALPTGLSLVSATPAQGVYNSGTGLWNIGALPKNATTTLTIVATVTQSGGLTNTATKTGEDQTDPVTSNDSSSVDLNAVPKADLSITKDDGVTTAIPGSSVTYTIVASNAGPSGVTGAKVVDVLPPSLTATWTCVGAGGGTCGASSGAGNINDLVNLPVGASVTYTVNALVSAAATGTLSNTATVTPPTGVIDPTPGNNSATDTDTLAPTADLSITKTDGVASVVPGTTVTYTIIASNNGPSNAPGAIVADTLPAALLNPTWTCVGAGGGTCTASGSGNINDTVNLPAGASVFYTVSATVSSAAIGTLSNTATVAAPAGVTDPTPGNNSATDTDTVVFPSLQVTKTSNGPWTVGQSGAKYTLTVTNAGTAATSGTITVLDTLPTGITASASFTSGLWTCTTSGQNVTCQRSAALGFTSGTNTDTITIPVTVGTTAVGTLTNHASVGGGGDPNGNPPDPTTCAAGDLHCGSTTTDITPPVVTVGKTSSPASGTAVSAGQTITYTLTATVANAPLSANLVLTDTLTGAQAFASMASAGAYTPDTSAAPTLKFTLPAGTPPGTYPVSYTTTVNANATGSVGNGVVPTGGGPNDPTCTNCTTTNPLKPKVTVSKSSNPASGSNVSAGDLITYTVQVVVANAPLANLLTLTDTPSANQTLGIVTNGPFNCSGTLVCTLPAGTAIGTYTLTYQMTVNANASGSVTNALVPSGSDNPICPGSCGTTHTLNPPLVSVAKTSNPVSGQNVVAGQTITYTLTATITQAALTSPLVLTDTLSANQTYVGVGAVNDGYTAGGSGSARTFTLPTGTVPGVYKVDYTATVNNNASGSVGNNVVPSGGSSTPPTCTTCSTTHPLSDPVIHVVKSANPADGATVAPSQLVTFTLTATVTNAALTSNLVLTDTLGTGLTFGSVASAGSYTSDVTNAPTLKFTLPSGTVPGTYAVSYTASVDANATGSVKNVVVATGGSPTGPACDTCTTTHPLAANVSIAKALTSESGTVAGVAEPGESLTYTITLTNTGGVDATGYNLSDAIPANTIFAAATDGGALNGANVNWTNLTVPKQVGATPGTKTVTVVFHVANPIPAGVTSIANIAYQTGTTPPTCPDPACVTTPTAGGVTLAKALTGESGAVTGVAEPGENLTYTITLTNTGGSDETGYALSDALPANTTFVSATDGGTLTAGVINWTGLTVPKQNGPTPGTKTVTVVIKVATPIPAGVTSIANVAYKTGSTPPTCPTRLV